MMNESAYFILAVLALLSLGVPALGNRFLFPIAHVLAKWIRWALFAGVFAALMEITGWSTRSAWVHLVIGGCLWFLLETIYYWVIIGALSRSPLPLFPKFQENLDGDEWPADACFLKVKDWLRENNYNQVAALKAELFEKNYLRVSIYDNSSTTSRIQVLFMPKNKGTPSIYFSINSISDGGDRLITDNHSLPFGGYYPKDWYHSRKPLIGSLAQLHKIHQQRLAKYSFARACFTRDPLSELNGQQRQLENLNIKNGIIVSPAEQDEVGMLTEEGRYRIWIEMWLIAYTGKARSATALSG